MSESISLSLTALLLGAALLAVNRPAWLRLSAALVIALAWVMARDTNAYAAVAVAPSLAVAFVVRRRAILAAALVGTMAVFAASVLDAREGGRADEPMRNAIWIRLQHDDPAALAWMEAHGYGGLYDSNTPAVYRSFLLHHPFWTAAEPLRNRLSSATFSSTDRLKALYTPSVLGYDSRGYRARIPGVVQRVFWPPQPARLGVELLVALALAIAGALLGGWRDSRLAAAVVTIIAVYPQVLVVWHASGQEIDRHALGVAVELRIAVLVIVALSADRILCRLAPWLRQALPDTDGLRRRFL
jgi:hypothetical protein